MRTKLLTFAVVLIVVPGAIYGTLTVWGSRASLATIIGRQLEDDARDAADRLGALLRAQRESLVSYARQDVMREIRIGDLDKRIASALGSLKLADAACLDLLVLDAGARIVAASHAAVIGNDGRSVAAASSEPAIVGPIVSPIHHAPALRISVPIPDPDAPDDMLGTLVAFYDWQRETAALGRARANFTAEGLDVRVLLVDAGDVVLAGASRNPSVESRFEATGMLFGRAALPADLPRWSIVIAQAQAEAFAPAIAAARLLILVLGSTLIVALGVAVVAARRITRPLAELTRAAGELGQGRAAVPVPVRSQDEIGTLAAAFNRMSVDLRRAEKELLEAAKFAFVGELAAGVAHEVRTPLGVMRSSAQMLERSLDGKDPESRELLQMLREEVDRIDHVVTNLLDLARPRELHVEPTPLGHVVFRAADFAEAQARDKGVTLVRGEDRPELVALCDAELVYQVALNLLVNAIQVLHEGARVEIRLLPRRVGFVGFEVRDDGPGVPEAIRERIFQPFFTQRTGGVGLGLTFVQRVVQEHRGKVGVESAPGHGAIFRVELPEATA